MWFYTRHDTVYSASETNSERHERRVQFAAWANAEGGALPHKTCFSDEVYPERFHEQAEYQTWAREAPNSAHV